MTYSELLLKVSTDPVFFVGLLGWFVFTLALFCEAGRGVGQWINSGIRGLISRFFSRKDES